MRSEQALTDRSVSVTSGPTLVRQIGTEHPFECLRASTGPSISRRASRRHGLMARLVQPVLRERDDFGTF